VHSAGLRLKMAKVEFMPSLKNVGQIGFNDSTNKGEFSWRKPPVLAQRDRSQPKLADQVFSLNVDVRWFAAIKAVEEQAVRALDISYSRHCNLV
jgi:hypothetical protein